MTEEDKKLLLKDLSARLPYRVECIVYKDFHFYERGKGIKPISELQILNGCYLHSFINDTVLGTSIIVDVKPYLFPLSSMTEEQLYELREMFGFEIEFNNGFIELSTFHHGCLGYLEMVALFEWFNKNHFDYRGLIPMGLAKDATGLNIY